MNNIGVIGTGNMGYPILKGLPNVVSLESITFYDINEERREVVSKELNISSSKSNSELVKFSKYIVLAVKPQYMSSVLEEIKEEITEEKIVISIAAGIDIKYIKDYVGNHVKTIRVMPNTPALIGAGMSVLSFSNDHFDESDIEFSKAIFTSVGEVEILEEKYMDAVVAISGSSPAYVYMFIEALADGGVLKGIPRSIAYKLAAQAVLGSAKMVLETKEHPGVLKDAVCSPGGTTIEALASLENNKFRGTVIEAMNACYEKAKKLK